MKRVFYIVAPTKDDEIDLGRLAAGGLGQNRFTYEEANGQARDAAHASGKSHYVIRCMVERRIVPMVQGTKRSSSRGG